MRLYSYDPFDHNDHNVSVYEGNSSVPKSSYLATRWVTHRGVRLDRSIQLHGSPTFLDNLGVLPMQASLLVLLHTRNLLFQPMQIPGRWSAITF